MKLKINHIEPYAKLRRDSYMSISDQLDVLYKLAKSMRESGFEMPIEVVDWIDSCNAIKEKFKKN